MITQFLVISWYKVFGEIDSLGKLLMAIFFLFLLFLFFESIIALKTGNLIFKFSPWWTWGDKYDVATNRRMAVYQIIGSGLILLILFFTYVLNFSLAPGYGIYQNNNCIYFCQ